MNNLGIKRSSLALLIAVALLLSGSKTLAVGQSAAEAVASLRARLSAHISQPRFAPAAWGVKVVSLDTGKTVFEHNAGKYFIPASNAKLYSTAVALDRLGGDYRIKTSLYAAARPNSSGTLKGDLIVYGRGDPTFAARLNDGDYYRALTPLVDALATAGVKRVDGDLIGDESYFKGPPFGSGWEWDDLQWYYGAEVSALSVNDNSVDLFVKPADRAGATCVITTGPPVPFISIVNRTQTGPKGSESSISVYRPVGENVIYVSGRLPVADTGYTGSVAVHNPAYLFVSLLKEELRKRGIKVKGQLRAMDWKAREVAPLDLSRLVELGRVESLPVKDMVRETLKPSQNLYAQLLLLQVGAAGCRAPGAACQAVEAEAMGQASDVNTHKPTIYQPGPAASFITSEQSGLEVMNSFLSTIGIKGGDVVLEEGSGLSRRDIITPAATVELLRFMSRHRWADAYREALPVAGADGTLKTRMKGTAAAGNVRAKTGFLSYVYALSGYVTTAAGERLAFSIMLNNYYNADRNIPAREDIDAIAIMLAGFTGRSQ